MKFKLVGQYDYTAKKSASCILLESRYGMIDRYTYQQLQNIALSDRILFKILSDDELLPGFSIYSNRSGSGISNSSFGVGSVVHHMNLTHGENTLITILSSSSKHNKIHAKLLKVIKDAFKAYEGVFRSAYELYEEDFNKAHDQLTAALSSGSSDAYSAIGLKFKAFEDYFRNIKRIFVKEQVNLSHLRNMVEKCIDDFNESNEINAHSTEKEFSSKLKKETAA